MSNKLSTALNTLTNKGHFIAILTIYHSDIQLLSSDTVHPSGPSGALCVVDSGPAPVEIRNQLPSFINEPSLFFSAASVLFSLFVSF